MVLLSRLARICIIIALQTASHAALYYKLSEADINGKDWPQRWYKYDILVADPGLKNASLAQIRKDLPRVRIVAYTCMGWVYVSAPCANCTGNRCSGCPGLRCIDRVDTTGKSYWNLNFTVRNLHDGRPICPFGGLNNEVTPVATWIPSKESVEAMVRYHKDHTVVGYDGIYVDDYRSSYYGAFLVYSMQWTLMLAFVQAHGPRILRPSVPHPNICNVVLTSQFMAPPNARTTAPGWS